MVPIMNDDSLYRMKVEIGKANVVRCCAMFCRGLEYHI